MISRLSMLFAVLIVVSLISTRFLPPIPLALSSAVAPVQQLLTRSAQNLRSAIASIIEDRRLRDENRDLRDHAAQLEEENRRLSNAVRQLEQALRVKREVSPGVVAIAGVTAIEPGALRSRMRIDKGYAENVRQLSVVTVPQGLVGVVWEVSQHEALVRTIIDPQSEIGVTIEHKGGRASARGVAGGRLRAEGFARDLQIKVGDIVLTLNAPGGVYPTIKVGVVSSVQPVAANALGQTVFIEPVVDFAELSEVFVLRPQ